MATSAAQFVSVFRCCGVWPLLLVMLLASFLPMAAGLPGWTGDARADEAGAPAQALPDLYQLYYDGGLLEYCNLGSPLAVAGFRARRADLLARDKPTEELHRRVRIAAATAVDNAYLDHGLGGQRLWCRTAGKAAFDRFEAYGRSANGRGTNGGGTGQ